MDDPLLIEGKKHDLRLYLLLIQAGKNGDFVAFLCEEGLARFCVEDYEKLSGNNSSLKNQNLRNGNVYTSGANNSG